MVKWKLSRRSQDQLRCTHEESYVIWKEHHEKYMENANFLCIGPESVASYCCAGMKLRRLKSRRSILSKLRHWPPGTDNLPFVPSFFAQNRWRLGGDCRSAQ